MLSAASGFCEDREDEENERQKDGEKQIHNGSRALFDDDIVERTFGDEMEVGLIAEIDGITGGVDIADEDGLVRNAEREDEDGDELFGKAELIADGFGIERADHTAAEPGFGCLEHNGLRGDADIDLTAVGIFADFGIAAHNDKCGGVMTFGREGTILQCARPRCIGDDGFDLVLLEHEPVLERLPVDSTRAKPRGINQCPEVFFPDFLGFIEAAVASGFNHDITNHNYISFC